MKWTDRVALGFFELFAVALLLFVAINYFTSISIITTDKVYGLFIGGVSLVILPL